MEGRDLHNSFTSWLHYSFSMISFFFLFSFCKSLFLFLFCGNEECVACLLNRELPNGASFESRLLYLWFILEGLDALLSSGLFTGLSSTPPPTFLLAFSLGCISSPRFYFIPDWGISVRSFRIFWIQFLSSLQCFLTIMKGAEGWYPKSSVSGLWWHLPKPVVLLLSSSIWLLLAHFHSFSFLYLFC